MSQRYRTNSHSFEIIQNGQELNREEEKKGLDQENELNVDSQVDSMIREAKYIDDS